MSAPRTGELGCTSITFAVVSVISGGLGLQQLGDSSAMTILLIAVAALFALLAVLGFREVASGYGATAPYREREALLPRKTASRFRAPSTAAQPQERCPFCHDGLDGGDVECRICKARYHEECVGEAGGCVIMGCAQTPRREAVRL